MSLDLFKKNAKVGVAIVTASCCYPGVAPFEEQAKRVVEQAISESGVPTELKILPVSTYYHSIPKEVIPKLLADFNQGKISAPPILIDGKAVYYGVPGIDELKTALIQAAEARKMKEEPTREPEPKSANIA
jgi:hypothetical protein